VAFVAVQIEAALQKHIAFHTSIVKLLTNPHHPPQEVEEEVEGTATQIRSQTVHIEGEDGAEVAEEVEVGEDMNDKPPTTISMHH